MFETLHPFAVALLIGLFVGIERERSHPKGVQALGVRTFLLIALLGALAAKIHEPILTTGITLLSFALVLSGYLRSTYKRKNADIGLTTEIAAGAVYCLGYLSYFDFRLSILLGTLVVSILISRSRLHHFVRKTLQPKEVNALAVLLFIVVIVIPLLPNHSVDPWKVINPRRLVSLAVLIGTLQFIGYVAARVLGDRRGALLYGFLGGLVSSTAIFATSSEDARRHPTSSSLSIGVCLFALTAMLVEFQIILTFTSTTMGLRFLAPSLSMIGLALGFGIWIGKNSGRINRISSRNPFELLSVMKLTGFIALLLIAISVAQRTLGTKGVVSLTFLAALFELHGVTLATANLYYQNGILLEAAIHTMQIALVASFISKLVLAVSINRGRFALKLSAILIFLLSVGGVIFWSTERYFS